MTGVPQNVVELYDVLIFAQSGTASRMLEGLLHLQCYSLNAQYITGRQH